MRGKLKYIINSVIFNIIYCAFFNKIRLQDVSEVNIQDEASTVFSRAKQFTEEKLGRTERTEYDLEFQQMEKKTDLTKSYTEKIKNNTAAVIIPNPSKK